jgi:hypothetical protein
MLVPMTPHLCLLPTQQWQKKKTIIDHIAQLKVKNKKKHKKKKMVG